EKRGRAPLYIGMAAVVAIGVVLALLLTRKGPAPAPAPASALRPAPAPTAAPVLADSTPAAPVATPGARDSRSVEQEVQRQLAAKRQENRNQKALKLATRLTAVPKAAAATRFPARPNAGVEARAEPTSVPRDPTSPPPEPT